jgi:tetratricopeptide (TPR) repeat protein
MSKFRIIVSFFLVGLWNISGYSTPPSLDSALQLLVKQNYTESLELIADYLKENPQSNEAAYLSVAIEQTKILDFESYLIEGKSFMIKADSVKKVLEERVKTLKGKDSTECIFYIANIYGGISVIQAKTGEWFNSVGNAVTSVSLLKQVLARDPQFYAANLGIGVFDYYLSTSFKWMPFVEDRMSEGLESVEAALKAPYPYNDAAKNSLCWILAERKEFRKADSLAQSVLDKNPTSTIFLRIKMIVNFWDGKYKTALTYAEKLIYLSENRNPVNWSDLIAGYDIYASCYDKLGNKKGAYDSSVRLLSKSIPQEYCKIPHIKKHLKNVSLIRDKNHLFAANYEK